MYTVLSNEYNMAEDTRRIVLRRRQGVSTLEFVSGRDYVVALPFLYFNIKLVVSDGGDVYLQSARMRQSDRPGTWDDAYLERFPNVSPDDGKLCFGTVTVSHDADADPEAEEFAKDCVEAFLKSRHNEDYYGDIEELMAEWANKTSKDPLWRLR